MVKAFGKFDKHGARGLRRFAIFFRIKNRAGEGAWQSGYPSIQMLLNHLRRYTQSECSRQKYLGYLMNFCMWTSLNPEQLVRLSKKRVERLIQEYVDAKSLRNSSKAYLNTLIKKLKTFFSVNGLEGDGKLNIRTYFVPTRYRKVPEYIPTKQEIYAMADGACGLRDRTLILVLWSSGLRVSTLCALNYGDVADELQRGELYVKIPVGPFMRQRLPEACKGMLPYYTFISQSATEALKNYLREREEKYAYLFSDAPLFTSEWHLWERDERPKKRLTAASIRKIIKRAAKFAGINQWKYVTPHTLRKAFEMVLCSPTVDNSRLDKATQEFFIGHVLAGSQDTYYDKSRVEHHRNEYAKLDFSREEPKSKATDKLILIDELEEHLAGGWLFIAKVSEDKVVVRKAF
jgi:integrase